MTKPKPKRHPAWSSPVPYPVAEADDPAPLARAGAVR